jgi:hypothetical protein
VANGMAETCWLCQLLVELHNPLSWVTLVYCDNVSIVYLSTNPIQHQRTKHVEIGLHFVRERVAVGDVRVLYVLMTSQFADIFTKGLHSSMFSLHVVNTIVKSAWKLWHDEFSSCFCDSSFSGTTNPSLKIMCFVDKQFAKKLCDRGISADYYHADMDIVTHEKIHM